MATNLVRNLSITGTQTLAEGTARNKDQDITVGLTNVSRTFNNGSGAGLVDLVAYKESTIAAGSPSTAASHDLSAMEAPGGATIAFNAIKGIYATYVDGGAAKIIVGATGSNEFESTFLNGTTPSLDLPKAGIFAIDNPQDAGGWDVTGSAKLIKYDAGTFTGTSAVAEAIYAGIA